MGSCFSIKPLPPRHEKGAQIFSDEPTATQDVSSSYHQNPGPATGKWASPATAPSQIPRGETEHTMKEAGEGEPSLQTPYLCHRLETNMSTPCPDLCRSHAIQQNPESWSSGRAITYQLCDPGLLWPWCLLWPVTADVDK